MLYAEVVVYSAERVGMMEYPSIRWGDLVTGDDITRIRQEGLEACLRGEQRAMSKVWLRALIEGKRVPLCETDVTIDIYDLRQLVGPRTRKDPKSHEELGCSRLLLAPTIDELRTMIQNDLPKMAEIWREDVPASEG